MLLVREIMYCKPGKVRPMVEKFRKMKQLDSSMADMRIMTDVSAERYWTIVAEMEVESLDAFLNMQPDPAHAKEFEEIMKDYHELVDYGRREVYKLEG